MQNTKQINSRRSKYVRIVIDELGNENKQIEKQSYITVGIFTPE